MFCTALVWYLQLPRSPPPSSLSTIAVRVYIYLFPLTTICPSVCPSVSMCLSMPSNGLCKMSSSSSSSSFYLSASVFISELTLSDQIHKHISIDRMWKMRNRGHWRHTFSLYLSNLVFPLPNRNSIEEREKERHDDYESGVAQWHIELILSSDEPLLLSAALPTLLMYTSYFLCSPTRTRTTSFRDWTFAR